MTISKKENKFLNLSRPSRSRKSQNFQNHLNFQKVRIFDRQLRWQVSKNIGITTTLVPRIRKGPQINQIYTAAKALKIKDISNPPKNSANNRKKAVEHAQPW